MDAALRIMARYSVIIPTCRRNDLLAQCLERLAPGAQTLSADAYEVIVTDDGGEAEALVKTRFPFARWIAGPRDGPAANRNSGARAARGEWLLFTDDDCLPDPNWIAEIARVGEEGRVDVIEGRTEIPDKIDSPFREGVENLHGGVFWSCNLAVRRKVFFELGGFDEDFKEAADEDVEFAWRFRQRGIPSCFAAGALVLHPVRAMTLGALWQKTKRLRWTELRALKTRGAPPFVTPAAKVLAQVFYKSLMTLFRTTWHLFTKFDSTQWRRQTFWQLWRWLTFPILVPYLAFWQIRFRRMLDERATARR